MENNVSVFKPLLPKRNSEEIALQIEEAIISKQYKPNDRLPPERELAVQFNAGRGAVREALRRLEGLGFIRVKPGREGGIFVNELNSSGMTKTLLDLVRIGDIDLKEITMVRILIETKVLELCIDSITDDGIEALEQNVSVCEELINRQKPVSDKHQNFHILVASFCKNRLLEHFLGAIIAICDTYIKSYSTGSLLPPSSHIQEHKAILNALKDKDKLKARKALLQHLSSVDKILREYRQH
jgi:GntR family transcriptional repressor for pyruvate dehydrogenase complex